MKQFIYFFCLVLLVPSVSFAYLDPATISIVIQGLVGAIATFLFFSKTTWYRFKTFCASFKKVQNTEAEEVSKN